LAACAVVDEPIRAAVPAIDAPAAPVKTCRREIPFDVVMMRCRGAWINRLIVNRSPGVVLIWNNR
jgi:hypothetical protein